VLEDVRGPKVGSCRRSAATAPTRTPSSAVRARTGSCRAWFSSATRATTSPTRAWTPLCGCAPRGSPPADVTAIELGVAKPVLRTIAEPPEAKARLASGCHAAFSGPYTVAAALLGGGLGVSHEDFTAAGARDPRRLALAALVRCVEDERCSASFPHAFPAVLRVTTRTGEELEARVEVSRGGPGNPLSDEELARKFHDNAVRSLPEERAAELAARTLAFPDAQSVEDLRAADLGGGALRSRQLPSRTA
jgi:hypothetical protein